MKKISFVLFTILALLLPLATATNSTIEPTSEVEITADQVTLDINYGDFDDDKQTLLTKSSSAISIKNNNAQAVKVTLSAIDLPSKYTVQSKEVTIEANATFDATLSFEVPQSQDGGSTTIGKIVVLGSAQTQLDSATLVQNTTQMIEMTKVEIDYTNKDGNSEDEDFDSDSEITYTFGESVSAGTKVSLEFKVSNKFDRNFNDDEGTLENIELEIKSNDDDLFADSFDENYDLSDIDADKDENLKVEFTIDEDADEDTYRFDIVLTAEDGADNKYEIEREINLEVERERDDLRITKMFISPAAITTCDNDFTLEVAVKNFGSDDQEDAAISIVSSELDINKRESGLIINENSDNDNTWRKTFNFNAGTKQGTYNLDITAYKDRDSSMDFERIEFVVDKCETPATVTEPDVPAATVTVTPPAVVTTTTTVNNQPTAAVISEEPKEQTSTANNTVKTIEDSYVTYDFIIAGIIVAMVLVLAVIILFIVLLIKG